MRSPEGHWGEGTIQWGQAGPTEKALQGTFGARSYKCHSRFQKKEKKNEVTCILNIYTQTNSECGFIRGVEYHAEGVRVSL